MKNLLFVSAIVFFSFVAHAQSKKTDTVYIHTSAQCEMCKDRIETALAYETGIKKSKLDVDSKILMVIYQPTRTDTTAIKKAISKVGYDANDVAADPKAYAKLPDCCKKEKEHHSCGGKH